MDVITSNKLKFLKEEEKYFPSFKNYTEYKSVMFDDIKQCTKCNICHWDICKKRCNC